MRATAGWLLLWALPSEALAHAFIERYDLPLPLWHYVTAAGITVAVSFVAIARVLDAKRASLLERRLSIESSAAWRALRHRTLTGTIGVLAAGLLFAGVAAGFLGVQGEPTENLLPVLVWILWWVGLTYVCALVGNTWPALNPWAAVARWTGALAANHGIERRALHLPPRLEIWPAVLLFFVFAWAELVWPSNAVPARLAAAALAYSLITWTAMALVGTEAWLRQGEPFTRFFSLIARFAPVHAGTLRPYGAGLVQAEPVSHSELAFVVLVLASVTFDGVKETAFWGALSTTASDALYRTGALQILGNVGASALLKTAGLVLLPLLFLAVFLLTGRWMSTLAGHPQRGAGWMARHFVLSLVPIAIGYHLAHYLSYLLIHGQAAIALASDPFGRGWNLLGTRDFKPDESLVGAAFVWNACVVSIVLGHVAAIAVAHLTALRLFGEARAAMRSQYPLVALMVAYTMLSLWVLSQPIVQH